MPTCEERNRDFAAECAKQAKRAAKVAKKPVVTLEMVRVAGVLAEAAAEDRASVLPPPPSRRVAETHMLAILPVRKYPTEAERKLARAATQRKCQAKAKRNVAKETARRDAERVRQKKWVAEKRAKTRAAKDAKVQAEYRKVYTLRLACFAGTAIIDGWSLPRRDNLRSLGQGLNPIALHARGY